ncbi:MAG: acylneuraminate cytidylyltransferase family protein [Bacteroidales bacterium]|nr:acylneuraminate cytidylyltransferase family protein [Bacteroidales bacterium]
MIEGKSVLAIIPARGGSKGVPRKNIRELCGKPLIAWTIEEAKKSKYIDRLILSSEDQEIIKIAQKWGCEVPFVRPSELSQDTTPGMAPVLHALDLLQSYDYIILLQATSPLRISRDIDDCLKLCLDKDAKSCVSVTESAETPYWMYKIDDDLQMHPLMDDANKYLRRQELPKTYIQNGALYVAQVEWLKKNKDFSSEETIAYIMPNERSLDIDNELDFQICELMLKEHQ